MHFWLYSRLQFLQLNVYFSLFSAMYSLKNEPETHFPSNNVTFRGTGMCLVRCVTCAKFWAGLTHRQTIFLFCQEYTSRLTVVLIYRKWKTYCFITLGADDNLFRFSSLMLSHCAIFLWTLIIQHVFFFFSFRWFPFLPHWSSPFLHFDFHFDHMSVFFTFRGCAWSWVMTALGAPHWDFQGNSNTLWCRRIAWLLIIETQNQDRK